MGFDEGVGGLVGFGDVAEAEAGGGLEVDVGEGEPGLQGLDDGGADGVVGGEGVVVGDVGEELDEGLREGLELDRGVFVFHADGLELGLEVVECGEEDRDGAGFDKGLLDRGVGEVGEGDGREGDEVFGLCCGREGEGEQEAGRLRGCEGRFGLVGCEESDEFGDERQEALCLGEAR